AACLAASGKGKEADKLDGRERADLRHKARAWLRDDVQAGTQALADNPTTAISVQEFLKHWQRDPDLVSVRDAKELAKLPEAERQSWQEFWSDVNRLLKEANGAIAKTNETNLNGKLTPKDREQLHEVKMRAGSTYVIDLTSKDFNTYLRVETAKKRILV